MSGVVLLVDRLLTAGGMFTDNNNWKEKLGAEYRITLYVDMGWVIVENSEVKATVKFIEELKIKNIEVLYNKKKGGG